MKSSQHPFGILVSGAGVMALNFAGSDRRDRGKVFAKSTGIVKFNPQEPMVAPHSKPAVKREVTGPSDHQARRNPNGIDGCPGSIPIVCSRRRGRGMLR